MAERGSVSLCSLPRVASRPTVCPRLSVLARVQLQYSAVVRPEPEAEGWYWDLEKQLAAELQAKQPEPEPDYSREYVPDPEPEQVLKLLQGLGLEQKVLIEIEEKLRPEPPVKTMTPREARAAAREARAQ